MTELHNSWELSLLSTLLKFGELCRVSRKEIRPFVLSWQDSPVPGYVQSGFFFLIVLQIFSLGKTLFELKVKYRGSDP